MSGTVGATLAPMIDATSFIPLYVQLADDIAANIQAGTLKPGTPVPSETELMEKHGISLGTVRAAVRLLRERELVRTIPARGTVLNGPA
jgi:GntR family transcriptional regulator